MFHFNETLDARTTVEHLRTRVRRLLSRPSVEEWFRAASPLVVHLLPEPFWLQVCLNEPSNEISLAPDRAASACPSAHPRCSLTCDSSSHVLDHTILLKTATAVAPLYDPATNLSTCVRRALRPPIARLRATLRAAGLALWCGSEHLSANLGNANSRARTCSSNHSVHTTQQAFANTMCVSTSIPCCAIWANFRTLQANTTSSASPYHSFEKIT